MLEPPPPPGPALAETVLSGLKVLFGSPI